MAFQAVTKKRQSLPESRRIWKITELGATTAPPDWTGLFWGITPLVDYVYLIVYLLRLFQADPVFSPVEGRMTGGRAARSIEV